MLTRQTHGARRFRDLLVVRAPLLLALLADHVPPREGVLGRGRRAGERRLVVAKNDPALPVPLPLALGAALDEGPGVRRGIDLGADAIAADGAPAGTKAPDFTLPLLDGGELVTLSDFEGDQPVALIFGSYT